MRYRGRVCATAPAWCPAAADKKASDQEQVAEASSANLARLGYIDHGNGTVTDSKTGLMWKQCAEGQNGPDCSGTALKYDWDTAMEIPKNLNLRGGLAGHSDWRVPTNDELETLVFHENQPSICLDAFPNTPYEAFWSSSEYGAKLAWFVLFDIGEVGISLRSNSYAVRLVRSSP